MPELEWPEHDVESIVETYQNHFRVIYGAGEYDDGMFKVKCRFKTEDGDAVEDNSIVVPALYGFHLERLCYLNRLYTLSWGFVIKTFFYDGKFEGSYADAADAMGRLWMYHHNALQKVTREVEVLKEEIDNPNVRIRALNEWVIREQYNLQLAEEDELVEYLDKDILKDPADFG
jgi:hypothetical protein